MVAVDVEVGAHAAPPDRDQVALSDSSSEMISTRRWDASPITSPPPAGRQSVGARLNLTDARFLTRSREAV